MDDRQQGYRAYFDDKPFDSNQSQEWQDGWDMASEDDFHDEDDYKGDTY